MRNDQELREQIDTLLDTGNLTKWEYSFLTEMGDRIDRGYRLTDDQEEKIQEIVDTRL